VGKEKEMDKEKLNKRNKDSSNCLSPLPEISYVSSVNEKTGAVELGSSDESVTITTTTPTEITNKSIDFSVDVGVKTLNSKAPDNAGNITLESETTDLLTINADTAGKIKFSAIPPTVDVGVKTLNNKTGVIEIKSTDNTLSVNNNISGIIDLSTEPSIAGVASLQDLTGDVNFISSDHSVSFTKMVGFPTLNVTANVGVKTFYKEDIASIVLKATAYSGFKPFFDDGGHVPCFLPFSFSNEYPALSSVRIEAFYCTEMETFSSLTYPPELVFSPSGEYGDISFEFKPEGLDIYIQDVDAHRLSKDNPKVVFDFPVPTFDISSLQWNFGGSLPGSTQETFFKIFSHIFFIGVYS
jgi:hypothetical protein